MRERIRIFYWLAVALLACATSALGKTWSVSVGDDCPTAFIPCFDPSVLTIDVGDSVLFFAYADIFHTGPHNLVADDGSFNFNPGFDVTVKFDKPGTITYRDVPQGIVGVINVIAAPLPEIEGRFTGTWFNAAQSGMGFMLEVLPGSPMQMLASWLTFSPDGGPSWIVGLGPIAGDHATLSATQTVGTGARFPPNFDPANVRAETWGELTFTFSDCNHGPVDWSTTIPGYESGGMDVTRLTELAGVTCL